MLSPPLTKEKKNVNWGKRRCSKFEIRFLVRESSFSLEIQAIRPSVVFGTRRKAALRGEGFAWVPDLRSFLKLRKVGVSPYLGFTLYLSVFIMLELFEALNGRLIGPKTWDRIVVNLKPKSYSP